MTEIEHWLRQTMKGRVSRREFIGRASALGVGTALVTTMLSAAGVAETPKQGGTLKQGISGGSSSDSFDPATWTDMVALNLGWQVFNSLVELNTKQEATPELAESWEAKPGASAWIFNIRKGVSFHNGKTLDADDVIYSIQHHLGPNSKSGGKAQLAGIKEIKKTDTHQIELSLDGPNADLPYNLADYHVMIVPNGFSDWTKPIGTGGYTLEQYEPGVRGITKRNPNYWKPGRAHFDSVETLVINDATARTNALISGQVHAINRVDRKTVDLLKHAPGVEIKRSSGGQHYTFVMNCDSAPFRDKNVRLAFKHAIDREKMLKIILRGYGHVGNDHPIPATDRFFNNELPQRKYDSDKAKFYLKKAGLSGTQVDLQASTAAFAEAIDAAVLYQAAAAKSGISINVKREPADGYWDNVWMKAPFCMCFWLGRPTADAIFSVIYKSDAAWNDAHWKRPDFDRLLLEARGELNFDKRKAMYWEMQRIVSEDGGELVPMFADYIDAISVKLKGFETSPVLDLSGQRLPELAWFES